MGTDSATLVVGLILGCYTALAYEGFHYRVCVLGGGGGEGAVGMVVTGLLGA